MRKWNKKTTHRTLHILTKSKKDRQSNEKKKLIPDRHPATKEDGFEASACVLNVDAC